ncbi:MAG: hypothetical protein ACI3ZT_07775 [Candidatus Cryptobacteroides sp.]
MSDIEYFKKELLPFFKLFDCKWRKYPEGDLGALEQIIFESPTLGGNIDFWENGHLGIYLYDYASDHEIYNKLLEPSEEHQTALKNIILKIVK